MKIEHVKAFDGQHCETTATGTLLGQIGIELSEPMLFGLGEGFGFIYWNMKKMDFPFIGGRIKPDLLTRNIAKNLNLKLIVNETTSSQKAWVNVKELIDNGHVVGLRLDCFYLQYFARPFHFAVHYVALYGYNEVDAFLVDTKQQGGLVKTSLKSLALARAEKGPMSSKNLSFTLQRGNKKIDLETAIVTAIKNNANDYLNPPITNIGYKGILKTGPEIKKWFNKSKNIENDFHSMAMMMEKAGTGGALFRNLYRDFLQESYNLLKLEQLKVAYEAFTEIALHWTTVSQLFEKVSQTKEVKYIQQATDVLKNISDKEKSTMELLTKL